MISAFRLSLFLLFQSTLPAGGATKRSTAEKARRLYFNPRSPRGERLKWYHVIDRDTRISIHAPRGGSDSRLKLCEEASDCISIHAPRGGSDGYSATGKQASSAFQSTLPAGGATLPFRAYCLIWNISIHAPRGGSDTGPMPYGGHRHNFNPRSPRGERR